MSSQFRSISDLFLLSDHLRNQDIVEISVIYAKKFKLFPRIQLLKWTLERQISCESFKQNFVYANVNFQK